ncbi:MAG: hypothetical protein GKR89_35275 [Candidatus Latescibacteria bacterium]|nr:hypothetical protein [Candidatus Latescibacterota bacterium]
MKKSAYIVWALAVVLLAVPVWAAPGLSDDFLFGRKAAYPTYAGERYINYNAVVPSRGAVFDRMGQFVNYGSYGLRWSEVRDRYTQDKVDAGLGVLDLEGSSDVLQQSNFFNFLAVVRQNYGDQYMSMAVGRNLSTTFTPLVLNHVTYGGLRVDYSSPRQDLTFLLSRGGTLEASLLFSRLRGDQRGFEELSPVIVAGANWKGHFGALDLGASFFRQLQSNVKSKPNSLVRGDVPYPEIRSPRMLKVRISDDSPRDLGAVAVYGADILLKAVIDSVAVRYTSRPGGATGNYQYRSGLEAEILEGRAVGDHWEADGAAEQIVAAFDLGALYAEEPDLVVVEAEIEVLVEGDYRIGMRQIYDFELPNGTIEERTWPFMPTGQFSLDQFNDHLGRDEMYFTVRRSRDSPATGKGPKTVRFKHLLPTAQSFYGVNLDWLTGRFHLTGEFVLNPQDFKFPTQAGKRQRETPHAGYLTLKAGTVGGKLGLELFRLEPEYGGWYDSQRGGLVLHTDVAELQGGVENAIRPMTQEFRTYDDNDDHDNWPDDYPGSADLLYMPAGPFNRPTYPSSRPEGGVYPGLDLNGDHVLDHDRNRNAVEDYLEAFIGFDSDPPEFVYGIDLNNNLVPDFRENDDEADYPYRRDQHGVHLFYDLANKPWWMSLVRMGWYKSEEIVGGHQMDSFYARLGLAAETPTFWLQFRDDVKRVRDDIADDIYRVVPIFDAGGTATRDAVALNQLYNQPTQPPPPDIMPMLNSLVNTAHLDSRWLPAQGLQVANSFKYVVNRKLEESRAGQVLQEEETLHNFSMVNKVSYSRPVLAKLSATVRMKHLLAKWGEGSFVPVDTLGTSIFERPVQEDDGSTRIDTVTQRETKASWSLLSPELLLTYRLTPRTSIELGQHGFFLPFLRGRFTDRRTGANSYRQDVSLVQLTMEGEYGGYRMVSNVGLRRERLELDRRSLAEDIDYTSFFVDVIFSPE